MVKKKTRKPSEKLLRTAKGIVKYHFVIPKKEVFLEAEACREFVEYYQKNLPSTDKQLYNSEKLEERTGLAPPLKIIGNNYLMHHWNSMVEEIAYFIENPAFGYPEAFDSRIPSERMLKFAQALAREFSVEIPSRVLREKNCCSAFLDHYQRIRQPTEKLLQSARTYAARAGIDVTSKVLATRLATMSWVCIMKRLCEFEGI